MTSQFGTIKQIGAVVIAVAVVLAAGTVVGQAPAIFGADVADDPEASIEFPDQRSDGTSVTIETVSLSEGGFVVVTSGDDIVGVSEYLDAGTHQNVTIEQHGDGDLEMLGQLRATVYHDATDDETFTPEADADEDDEHDSPYIDDGYPVSDTATVTMAESDGDRATSTSYLVESVEAPETARMNGSIEITTVIRNPNDFDDRQHVDVRLDGEMVERQVLSLEPGETRELNYTIDLSDIEPGEYIYGVYTNEDGELGEITVEGPAPRVSVIEAESDRVVADAALASEGFLAVESGDETDDGTASIVGTSDRLDAGDHESVTIDLEESLEDGETVTVVVYEGDPDDRGNVTAVEADGERVEETATVGESGDNSGDENGTNSTDNGTEADSND